MKTCEEELIFVRNLYDDLFAQMEQIKNGRDRLRDAAHGAMGEIGVPQPGYPQSVANAYEILRKALAGDTE